MCEFAYMKLYPADLLADTEALTAADFGSYMLLLISLWRKGGRLRLDHGALARIARRPSNRWQETWGRLVEYFQVSPDGLWISQKRLCKELDEAREQSGKQRAKAAKRWSGQTNKSDTRVSNNEPAKPLADIEAVDAAASPPARATPYPYKDSLDEYGKCSAREGRAMPQPTPDEQRNRAVVEERFAKGFQALSQSLDAVLQEAALAKAKRKSREQPAEEAAAA